MKYSILIWLFPTFLVSPDLQQIRNYFNLAVNSEVKTKEMLSLLGGENHQQPVLKAYYAAAYALQAKFHWNPAQKIGFVKKSQEWLAEAILADPFNPEIRYLRLTQEMNLPDFLGYNHQKADIAALVTAFKLKQLGTTVKSMQKEIASYIIVKTNCSAMDKKIFIPFVQ